MASVTKEDVVSFIENMSVLELSQLVKDLETKFGVSAAAPMAVAAMPGAAGGAPAAECAARIAQRLAARPHRVHAELQPDETHYGCGRAAASLFC